MNLVRSLMGRRQFLIAAGAASTSALAYKKLAGVVDPVFQTSSAMAAGKSGAAAAKGLTDNYPHLLSPLRIKNKILKNRILHTPSPPHSLQGPENFPADPYRSHYSDIAKNAAIVTMVEHFGEYPKTWDPNATGGPAHYSDHNWEDIPPVHNYVDQMIEEIHCEGSLICCGRLGGGVPGEAGSVDNEDWVAQAKKYEDKGYDVVEVGERGWTDGIEVVQSVIDKLEAVRKASDLIIVAVILPYTPGLSRGTPGLNGDLPDATGPEMEEVVAMVKMLDGLVDIVRMKDVGHFTNHPNSFTMEKNKPWMLPFAQAIKESGVKVITCPTGGFHDPALNDGWIASGKTDMVGMATPLIADPEYVKKAHEGRGEDIVPCIRCHDCHGVSRSTGPWFDVCSVNPKWGLSETQKRSIRPATTIKKVAVIGGGPGGMKAALVAAERGHKVTLYEKSDALGGLLHHTDLSQWTWAQKDFKDYLIRQVNKAGIDVQLKTEATPEMIKTKGYDTVLVATGSEPVIPKLPGADGKNVYNIISVYYNKKSLGKNVVMIGAGVFGTETGIGLAKDGYKVTVLASGKEMIEAKFIGPHNKENQKDLYKSHPNFSYILEATTTRIADGKVFYRDTAGSEKSVPADSVVIYGGLKPMMDEAIKFSGSAGQVLFLGDCTGQAGTIQKTIRSAFFVASQV